MIGDCRSGRDGWPLHAVRPVPRRPGRRDRARGVCRPGTRAQPARRAGRPRQRVRPAGRRRRHPRGDRPRRRRLAGVLFNGIADGVYDRVETDVTPFLADRDRPVVGVVPRTHELAGVTVAAFATELGAEVLTDTPTDAYVERQLVGAMRADASLQYFRRTKDAVVVTGGDRSDIHTVALEAPSVKCLCLTGGFRPSSAVVGKAEERGVPVLVVDGTRCRRSNRPNRSSTAAEPRTRRRSDGCATCSRTSPRSTRCSARTGRREPLWTTSRRRSSRRERHHRLPSETVESVGADRVVEPSSDHRPVVTAGGTPVTGRRSTARKPPRGAGSRCRSEGGCRS